jgi:hypothetical protein
VLREHRADGNLVRRPCRPPALRTEALLERHVEPQQPRLQRICPRPRNPSPAKASPQVG